MLNFFYKTALILALAAIFPSLHARQPYHATVTVSGESEEVSAPNLVDLKRELNTDALEQLIPIYTPTSAVSFDVNLRGIEVLAGFAASSTTLVVSIPQAGLTASFTGSTRDESLALFKDFLKDTAPAKGLLKAYARYSPIDPIAGNPTSLMAQMAASDYSLGVLSPLSGCECGWRAQPVIHQFKVGVVGTRAFSKGFDATLIHIPLRYSYSPFNSWALILDAPMTYLRNGGASSFVGSLGAALRQPINPYLAFTYSFRAGSGGSLDLCTAGSFILAGFNSTFQYDFNAIVFRMTNYAGYMSATNFWLTGINFNYRLQSYVFKNGISFTSCKGYRFCSRPLHFSLSFVDTFFSKSRLFIRHYDEVGLSLITTGINRCLNYDSLTLGLVYQFGEKSYKGYTVKLDYEF